MAKNNGMSTGTKVLLGSTIGVLCLVMIIISTFVGTYNTLITATQDIDNQWSNVKTEYQRRADLIYNVAEVAKSYANFEQETFVEVAKARNINLNGATRQDQMKELNGFDSTLSKLMLVFEAYPQLRSIEQYNKLTEELQRTENRIQTSRTDYNALVRSYNIYRNKFPTAALASMYGFKEQPYFENEVGTEVGVKLNMSR